MVSLPGNQRPEHWLPDGRILYSSLDSEAEGLFIFDPDGGDPVFYDRVVTSSEPGLSFVGATVSPDGTLIAFSSILPGSNFSDVWLREFPEPLGRRYRATTSGGYNPRWSADGDTLYYWMRRGQNADSLMAATIDRSSGVRVHDHRVVHVTEYRGWDLHPDGERIVVAAAGVYSEGGGGRDRYLVTVNWFEDYRSRR